MDVDALVTLTQTIGFPAVFLCALTFGGYQLGLKALEILEPNVQRIVDRHITFLDQLSNQLTKIDEIHSAVTEKKHEQEVRTRLNGPCEDH
ncbi:hypothetical protein Pla110_06720 [Polystyrenella longa]|uniref:YvrJ protein family protein n=1 Tax=Polystyrenella longa TaxID=2528007 RepID=A0A518CIA5_9PLAN|nr:hypothetical protein [Polystyrenella longa]QDU78968.1 hypothetical protein Pla110_06720 [Polystyrenella longa]